MAQLSLSQLLDVAIGPPGVGAINFMALRSLLQAVLGHLGLQDLPVQKQGHSPTPVLERDQPAKATPVLEKEGDRAQGTGQQPQEPEQRLPGKDPLQNTSGPQLASEAADMRRMKKKIKVNESSIFKTLEEINAMKAAQSRMAEEIRAMQEALGLRKFQDAGSQVPGPGDQTTLDCDVVRPRAHLDPAPGQEKRLKERLSPCPAPEEIRQPEDALGKPGVAGGDWKVRGSDKISLQLGSTLKKVKQELMEMKDMGLQEIERELKELGEHQERTKATLKQLVTQTAEQIKAQQHKLRAIESAGQEQAEAQAAHPVCSTDTRAQALFQFPERLEKDKADKEDSVLGTDVKADTTALASKFSHTEFDTSMKRLNEAVEEMLSQVADQEQVERQFNEEVASKLDRLELGAFRQQLEAHSKRIVEQLQEKAPQTEADDAAAIKEEPAAEGGNPTVPQSCGDQHTNTTPLQRLQCLRRPRRLQPLLLPNKRNVTGLLGKDGRIRRGRLDQQLPAEQGLHQTDPAPGHPGRDSSSQSAGF